MASMKLWGVFSMLLIMMINRKSKAMDLFPPPRQVRESSSRRQMMLVPSFVQQAATPTMFFVGGGSFERPRQHFRPMSSEISTSSEELPPRINITPPPLPTPPRQVRPQSFVQQGRPVPTGEPRPQTPPPARIQQTGRIVHRPNQLIQQQRPFDIRTAAATPERPGSFLRPEIDDSDRFRSVPPTFFIEDELPFPPMFEVPPRHFQQTNLRTHPQQFRPRPPQTRPPQTRPSTTRPPLRQTPSSLRPLPSPEDNFRHESPAKQPQTRPPQAPEEEFQQEMRAKQPQTRPPQRQEEAFRQEMRAKQPQTRPPQVPEKAFRQEMRTKQPRTRPPQLPEEAFRQEHETKQPIPQSQTHILPSVLDSLHQSDVSLFIPGEAGRDYPLFNDVPATHFACRKEMVSNFVADVETRCQVVRVCREDGGVDNFLCPNGTLFDDDSQFCNWWYRVPCGENPDVNQIPHRGRTIPQSERHNRFRQRPDQGQPRPQRPLESERDQSHFRPDPELQREEGKMNHGLDGFFGQQPPHPLASPPREENFAVGEGGVPHFQFQNPRPQRPQEEDGFFRGNLDDFFGRPRLVDTRRPESQEMTPQTSEETESLPPPTTVMTTTVMTTPRPTLVITTRPRTRKRPSERQRTRKPFSTRVPTTIVHEFDQSELEVGGFGLTEEEAEKITTRRPIATVRNRGRATFRPRPQMDPDEVFLTEMPEENFPTTPVNLQGEFDPFFEDQNRDVETTTFTDPPTTTATQPVTTTKRKFKPRRTTTQRPSSTTRKTTRKMKTKLTPSTTRFRHRSTKRPPNRKNPRVKPLTTTISTTTTEETTELLLSRDGDVPSATPFLVETERPVARKLKKFPEENSNLEVQHFGRDPFLHVGPEVHSSPFSDLMSPISVSTPVNFDPFYFGPAVTRDFPGPVSLDELPVAGVLPEDTLLPNQHESSSAFPPSSSSFEPSSTVLTTPKVKLETTQTKLRTSSKRKSKNRKNKVSTSTFASARKTTTSDPEVSSSTIRSRSKSRSRSRSRSRSKSRKTTSTTFSPDDSIPSSTERIFATARSRAQLFPTRQSLMKKTTFGQKQKEKETESSTPLSEVAEEAQESNTITVAETTPAVLSSPPTTVIPNTSTNSESNNVTVT